MSTLEDAHVSHQPVRACYVDFAAAYSTVPHDKLAEILQLRGIPQDFINAIMDLYEDRGGHKPTTRIKTPAGMTRPIPIERGVLQGDGLSPQLFSLFIQVLLDWLEEGAESYALGTVPNAQRTAPDAGIGAFADDLVILTHSAAAMRRQLEKN